MSNVAKIIEKAAKLYMMKFIEEKRLISERQFGFRAGKSTQDAISYLVESIKDELDAGNKPIVTYMDVSKAFDSIPHNLLLKTFYDVGFEPGFVSWLHSYLADRQQRVKIESSLSDPRSFRYSIPQGTVLGPLCFIIYINSLLELSGVEGDLISFADDTALITSTSTWAETISKTKENMKKIGQWFSEHSLQMNIKKSNFMAFSLRSTNVPIIGSMICHQRNCHEKGGCACSSINQVAQTKYLGVVIDQCLTWNAHVRSLNSRLRKMIPICLGVRNILSLGSKRMFYFALMGYAGTSVLEPLYITQKCLVKILLRKSSRHSTIELFRCSQVLSLKAIACKVALIYVFRDIQLGKIDYVVNPTRTASRQFLRIPFRRTSSAQNSYRYHGMNLYNALPADYKQCSQMSQFKSMVKRLFLASI
uniref:Putative RNA-directed DNA polymerase from transposon BS n=1 Tax=Lygus hesperus TaxID=30085 RepID=A0A0A9W4I8_LYGHE